MSAPTQVTVGTSAVAVSGSSATPRNGVLLQAHPSNSASSVIYVGIASNVATTTGFALSPGASVFVPVAEAPDAAGLFAIGSTTGLTLCVWVQ